MALAFRNLAFKGFRIERFGTLIFPSVRAASSTPQTAPAGDYLKKVEDVASKYSQHISEAVNRWEKCDEVYYGKERDMKNFPTVKYPITHPKVRLGFLPDSWFQALYPKTGVTGPYLFLFGSTAFLLSKEIWVVDPHFVELGVFVVIVTWLIKRFGPIISKRLDADLEELEQTRYHKPMNALIGNLDKTISTADEEIARSSAVKDLIKAKEENLDLQLEAAYRERLQQVYRAVHRRLFLTVNGKSKDRPYSIRANGFGSEPYLSASLTNGNFHLLGPNHEGGKHQPKSKPKLTFSWSCAKSWPDSRIVSSSLAQLVQKEPIHENLHS